MPKRRDCPTGKAPYRTRQLAALGARRFAQHLVRDGKITYPMYVYECICESLHLTRSAEHYGSRNRLIFQPVTPKLQVELFAPDARQLYEERRERDREAQAAERLRKLPDPLPQPVRQSYANRPKSLRYK